MDYKAKPQTRYIPGQYQCRFPSLAMVYPPSQSFVKLIALEDALECGTLFEDLYMPFKGFDTSCGRGADRRCNR